MQRRNSLFQTFCIVAGPQDYFVLTDKDLLSGCDYGLGGRGALPGVVCQWEKSRFYTVVWKFQKFVKNVH